MKRAAVLAWLTMALAVLAQEAPLRVVTSFYPMYVAVLNVVGDAPGVEVANLAPPLTGCLHDYQMTTADLVTLARADVFVVNGLGMESFLDKALAQVPRLKVVDAGRGIEPLDGNPHVWLSVPLCRRQVRNIAEGLALADPERAASYRENAAAYDARLAELDVRMREGLKDLRTRDIVTFHEAFPYFAQEFGLNVVTVIEREPGSEPSARELADTIRLVREERVTSLFAEPQYPAKAAEAIARETGAAVYTLDPAVTGPMTAGAYIDIMDANLRELQRALK